MFDQKVEEKDGLYSKYADQYNIINTFILFDQKVEEKDGL